MKGCFFLFEIRSGLLQCFTEAAVINAHGAQAQLGYHSADISLAFDSTSPAHVEGRAPVLGLIPLLSKVGAAGEGGTVVAFNMDL